MSFPLLHANEYSKKLHIFEGVTEARKSDLLGILGSCEGQFPIRYRGIPLSPKKLYVADYDPLMSKLTSRILELQMVELCRTTCPCPVSLSKQLKILGLHFPIPVHV